MDVVQQRAVILRASDENAQKTSTCTSAIDTVRATVADAGFGGLFYSESALEIRP